MSSFLSVVGLIEKSKDVSLVPMSKFAVPRTEPSPGGVVAVDLPVASFIANGTSLRTAMLISEFSPRIPAVLVVMTNTPDDDAINRGDEV